MEQHTARRERRTRWLLLAGIASLLVSWLGVRDYFASSWTVLDFGPLFAFGLFVLFALYILWSALVNGGRHALRDVRIPALILLAGIGIAALFDHLGRERRAVPVLLAAHYDGDINGVGIRLRTDGTYEATNASILGGETLYGTYRLDGDTIHLLTEDFRLDDMRWTYRMRLIITPNGVNFMEGVAADDPSYTMRILLDER